MPDEIPAPPPENAAGAKTHDIPAPVAPAAPAKKVSDAAPAASAAPPRAANGKQPPSSGNPILPLRDLMYGLIYPAVLGTGLVLSGQRMTKEASVVAALIDPALWVAAAAGLFFAASFASVFEKPEGPSKEGEWYGW